MKLFGRKQSLGWVPFEPYSAKMTLLKECIEMKRVILIGSLLFLLAGCTTTVQGTVPVQEAATAVIPSMGPTENSNPWKQLSDMLTPRSEMHAVELNGLIYVFGGFGPVPGGAANGKDSVATLEAYDPKTDQWTSLAPAPEARDHSMMAAFQGRIYVFGGYAKDWKVFSNVWTYDPAANQWTILNPMPASRTAGAAVTLGDHIYLIGGITSQAHVILPTWRYDPANDTWTDAAPLLQPREHVDAVALDGLIYALSGRWIETLNTVEIYDPVKDQWTPGVPMKDKRAGFGATVMNGKIYVAGGELIEIGKTVKSAEEFDPARQTWSSLPDLPGGLHGVPLIGFENVLYIIGGSARAADMINWGRVFAYQP